MGIINIVQIKKTSEGQESVPYCRMHASLVSFPRDQSCEYIARQSSTETRENTNCDAAEKKARNASVSILTKFLI